MTDPLPEEEDEAPLPLPVLYSVGGVTLATFFGTPLAGSILLALNESRLGRKDKARLAVVGGVVATAVLFVLAIVLPDEIGKFLALGSIIAMRGVAQQLQGARIEDHKKAGGKIASLWKAFGVGVLGFLAVAANFTVYFLVAGFMPDLSQKHMKFGDSEVLYSKDVSDADAAALGKCLVEDGYFQGHANQAGLERRAPGVLTVRFFVNEGVWNDQKFLGLFETMRRDEIAPLFTGTKIELELCDAAGDVKKTLR